MYGERKYIQRIRKKNDVHPAWKVLFAVCCIYGATAGLINNCRGIFFAPAAMALGVNVTTYSIYLTFGCITGLIFMPFVTKLFQRLSVKLVLTAYLLLLCACTVLLGRVKTLYQSYFIGALQGIVTAFITNYPIAYLVKRWFVKKKGLAMGIATASSGFVGAIMSLVYDQLILSVGWRTSYMIMGTCAFIIATIPTILFIHRDPSD